MSNDQLFPMTVVDLTKQMIGFASVTPMDEGVQAFLMNLLTSNGFTCHPLAIGRDGRPVIQNFVAWHGHGHQHLAFNGHTDVADAKSLEGWTKTTPFEALEQDGYVYGRGAEDMKGGLAAAVMAAIGFVKQYPHHPGTISLLVTGDEETDGFDGTPWIAEWLLAQDMCPDACIIPEPVSIGGICRTLRHGSRGCYEAKIRIFGRGGHSADENISENPIYLVAPLLEFFRNVKLDNGHGPFQPTSVQVVSIQSGNMDKYNIIPGDLTFNLNVRYTDLHSTETLKAWLCDTCISLGLKYELIKSWSFSDAFVSEPGAFTELVQRTIKEILDVEASLSVFGGASDARVLSKICSTIEIGPTRDTLHKVDERVSVDELHKLQQVFEGIIARFLAT